ncbi:MAG: sigma-54-dependent transcriptional regulator [Halocynthiibacter sp.]
MSDILIVDDEKDIRELISDILQDEGYATRMAMNSETCMEAVKAQKPSLMILDIWLKDSDMDGIDILKVIKKDYPDVPVVIISGHGNVEIAVAAIKQGAYDFIEKPFNIDQLMVVIARAMETSRLRHENTVLKRQDETSSLMIGEAPAFRTMTAALDKVASSLGRVMLTGASGSGKEVAARYIHDNSDRASGPFVTVSPSGLSDTEIEAALFGVLEGGSHDEGAIERAGGGTLYLDEVADLPLDTQSKLVRVLVENKFQPLKSPVKRPADIRVVSSTAKDLETEIEAGRFKSELFHRLSVIPVPVPSLEDRREDIPNLAAYFIESFNQSQGLPLRQLAEDASAVLQSMDWPGNIRQLRNIIERVLILGPEDGAIEDSEIPQNEGGETTDSTLLPVAISSLPLREAREVFEREYLLTQINRFGGNISRTAAFVGMERSALHRKLKALKIVTAAKAGARVAVVEDSSEDTDVTKGDAS